MSGDSPFYMIDNNIDIVLAEIDFDHIKRHYDVIDSNFRSDIDQCWSCDANRH